MLNLTKWYIQIIKNDTEDKFGETWICMFSHNATEDINFWQEYHKCDVQWYRGKLLLLVINFKFDYLLKKVSAKFLYYESLFSPFVSNKYLGGDTHRCEYWTYLCNTLSSLLLLMGYLFWRLRNATWMPLSIRLLNAVWFSGSCSSERQMNILKLKHSFN